MKKLVLISGVSGAGKTTASNILEDMGYLCIDSYPVELLENLIDLITRDDSFKYENVALTISINDLSSFYNLLSNSNINLKLILITAKTEVLVNRYKFTRRVHPLLISNKAVTLDEAIAIEKGILNDFKAKNAHVIDTSTLSLKQHKDMLDEILEYDENKNLGLTFLSFGFKYGVPNDADMVFDVRFLDNPYYVESLKEKTGMDKEVYDFVLNNDAGKNYLEKLTAYIDLCLDSYSTEERRHLTICTGCTGGQHRSVAVTEYLYNHYKDKYTCYLKHREQSK